MTDEGKYAQLFGAFDQLSILVVGDVMVDAYLWGSVDRISPEAPIPVVALRRRENRLGGAANVALNVKALGCRPVLCSVIGLDEMGIRFLNLLEESKIIQTGIIQSAERSTTTKFRIFGNHYQLLRVDEEQDHDLTPEEFRMLEERIAAILTKTNIDAIILQDYNKGVISPKLIQSVVTMAAERKIPVAVDPKKRNFEAYKGVTLFKPNLKELREGVGMENLDGNDQEPLVKAAQTLRKKLDCRFVMTTLSEKGMLISFEDETGEQNLFMPSFTRSVADVSGAGDTVISVAAACLANDLPPAAIARISNLAGGLVCGEVGVVPVSKEKLLKELIALPDTDEL